MVRILSLVSVSLLLATTTLSAQTADPRVVMETELGTITLEIYLDAAPITAANFLRYVDEDRFEGATFYRVVRMDNQPDNEFRIEVIQGGPRGGNREDRLPPIEHETTDVTGIRHQDGVISMARNRPGSASSEFFICVGDQPELDFGGRRNPDGQGFAAFGRVISGMDVVRKIQQLEPGRGQYLEAPMAISRIARVKP
jgi:peptidyl-prolyl cis-trans isomerase A (cyclophilin A)